MEFKKYTPQQLRFGIEVELKTGTDDVAAASMKAIANLKKDPLHYEKRYQYSGMAKARMTKYIRRTPKPGGGWNYEYADKPGSKRAVVKKPENKELMSNANIIKQMLPHYYNYTEKDIKRITDILPTGNLNASKTESYNDNNWSDENNTGYKEYEFKNGKMFFGMGGVQELENDIPAPDYPYFFRATNNLKEHELGDFKSTNYNTGQKEKGMSVSPHPRYAVFNNLKHLYAVTGDVVGYGSDGEPLLKNVKFLKKLNIKEAEKEHTIKKLESGIKFLKDKGMNDPGKILNVLQRLRGYNLDNIDNLSKAKNEPQPANGTIKPSTKYIKISNKKNKWYKISKK